MLAGLVAGCADSKRLASTAPPSSGSPVATASTAQAARPRYLALGDSFTIGTGSTPLQSFPAKLVGLWQSHGCEVTLENVAVNGYTTEDVLEREVPRIDSFKPTLITVAAGANDIVHGRTLDAYRATVRRILDAAVASGAQVVVVPQPDWSRSPVAASFGSRDVIAASIQTFNGALAEEARARRLAFVDLFPLMQEQAQKGQVASDGLHPSADAYGAWASALAKALPSPCPP